MRRLALVTALLVAFCAQLAAAPDIGGTPERVVFLGPASPVVLYAGRSTKALLEFRVGAAYHINSNTPKSELLIPTQLQLTPLPEVAIGKLTYPAGLDATFPFAPTETLNVYAGKFMITAVLNAASKTAPGNYKVHGSLKFQACDDRACYPPKQLPIDFEVTVKKSTSDDKPKVKNQLGN